MQDNNTIHTLSSATINQIAAGEVVQRPSSVVKELMENSIDAGASKIDVVIKDAGRTLIQVIDNGKGMSATDSVKAFERHATSKIVDASDLYALTTMGFRGEALASIAAVSRVELKTRREDDELCSKVEIEGGELMSQELISGQKGTQILVKDLFYNIPVRRKFLKTNETELRNILNVFQQIALVYPSLELSLSHNGTVLFDLHKDNFRQRIASICGAKTSKELLSINVDTTLARISGFISTPESAVKKQPSQYFFVNGRYIQHPYFAKAISLGFDRLLPTDSKPQFFIYFDIEPDKIDVNIHPTKTEVKFEDEQALFPILVSAVKEALASSCSMPTLMFDQEDRIEIPSAVTDLSAIKTPNTGFNPSYNPFSGTHTPKSKTDGWQNLYDTVKGVKTIGEPCENEYGLKPDIKSDDLGLDVKPKFSGFVYGGKYIICNSEYGVLFVNIYRASQRVWYDRLSDMMVKGTGAGQMLMFPELLELTPAENLTFRQMRNSFESVGYSFEDFGVSTYKVNAIPSMIKDSESIAIIKDIISDPDVDVNGISSVLRERLLINLSNKSAVREVTSTDMAESLVESLFNTTSPMYAPDGLPIYFTIDSNEIKRRIG